MHGHCAQAALATFNICSQMFKYIVYFPLALALTPKSNWVIMMAG